MAYDVNKIPKLPHGEGTISIYDDNRLIYKKTIKLKDGTSKRSSVYGSTPKECMTKMRELENRLNSSVLSPDKEVLCDAMYKWLETTKKPTLKSQSYQRLESTIRNQIESSDIGHARYQSITSDELQQIINDLNDNKHYSKSVIKKTYDCLNDFYRYSSAKYKIDNPMLLVTMPVVSNIKSEQREIVWFEQDDIDKFIEESEAKYRTGRPKYSGGLAFAANIYLGMRCGELLALQWKDIDFDKNTIYVCKTLIEENNPDYNPNDSESKKVRFVVQKSNKTNQNRYVPINSKAKSLLLKYKQTCIYTEPEDYVISTRNRKTTTVKNADDTIKKIQENAETDIQGASSHSLRHTCASLYFRAGVSIETIAKILGHSVDVCRKTYVHFVEEQLKEAASKIDVIEI